ncbi:MAG: transposase [Anaerolineaceae bacterium]|nr:transposase [Anaerolineaceae bacterium]
MLPLVPEKSEVVLLGDAEYDTTEMLSWVETETSWRFAMHTSPSILVKSGVAWEKIKEFTVRKGRLRMIPAVAFTKTSALPANLIVRWGAEYKNPISLVSNLPSGSLACWYYRRRFRIETFFSDQKSRCFHIHKSHLSSPERVVTLPYNSAKQK